jgi:hypothetical protein
LREWIELDPNEWEEALAPGDPVLDLHIPAGGGMHLAVAKESFERAFRFFSDRFGFRAGAVVCRSWIFNTQLEERLPESNLAALMRNVYLLPCRSSGTDGLFFVFCRTYERLDDYPQNTRLERTLVDVLRGGGRLRSAGMLLMREDVSSLGSETYRHAWTAFRSTT